MTISVVGRPSQRLMRQPTGHRVTRLAFTSAPTTPSVRLDHPARQDRPIGLQPLAGDNQPHLIKAAERRQIRSGQPKPSSQVASSTSRSSGRGVEELSSSEDLDPQPNTDATTSPHQPLHPQLGRAGLGGEARKPSFIPGGL